MACKALAVNCIFLFGKKKKEEERFSLVKTINARWMRERRCEKARMNWKTGTKNVYFYKCHFNIWFLSPEALFRAKCLSNKKISEVLRAEISQFFISFLLCTIKKKYLLGAVILRTTSRKEECIIQFMKTNKQNRNYWFESRLCASQSFFLP